MTDEQKEMLAVLRQEAQENRYWVKLQKAFEEATPTFNGGLVSSLLKGVNIDHYWRTYAFVKYSVVFATPQELGPLPADYLDQIKSHLKGIGKITKGKNGLQLSMPNGNYHIDVYRWNQGRKSYDAYHLSVFDTFKILMGNNDFYFMDEPEIAVRKFILMDELVGSVIKPEFEELKSYLLKMEKIRTLAKKSFEAVLKNKMGQREYSLIDRTEFSEYKLKYRMVVGEAYFDMSVPMDNPNFNEIAAKFVELYDLTKDAVEG